MFLATALICSLGIEPQVCETIYAQVPPFQDEQECDMFSLTIFIVANDPIFASYLETLVGSSEYTIAPSCIVQETET